MRRTIRIVVLAIGVLASALLSPAQASRGCWHDGYSWRCAEGCRIVQHWYDDYGRQWIRHICFPSHETMLLIGLGGMVVCFFIGAAWCSRSGRKALRRQAADVDAETAAANTLAGAADDLTREIDAYIETTKRTAYQRGRDSF